MPALKWWPAASPSRQEQVGRRKARNGTLTLRKHVLELFQVDAVADVRFGGRLAGEELRELGIKVDERARDHLTFGRVRFQELGLGSAGHD